MSAAAIAAERALVPSDDQAAWFARLRGELAAGKLAPYLGPGLSATCPDVKYPTSYPALAAYLGSRVALPRRARGNAWSAAQFIESQKHRATVTTLMTAAFSASPPPAIAFYEYLATLRLPLIVDTWYDAALRRAFSARRDWVEVQGNTRAGIGESRWFRIYDGSGAEALPGAAREAATLVYKPHGGLEPAQNYLITDADYVEVLTEIDIQNPIPEPVQARRGDLGFLFLGCRFDDQMLRTYARQIAKRSRGPHFAVFEPAELTRMERRFLAELGISAVSCELSEALARLST